MRPERKENVFVGVKTKRDPEYVENRVNNLINEMTIEEKVAQMHQCSSRDLADQESFRQGSIGSVVLAASAFISDREQDPVDAEQLNNIQRIATRESRLGIPVLFGRDVIHGYRTVFPIPLGQAGSWDPELVEKAAGIAAREAAADGVRWTFAPMLDIARDPRWGRIAEGFGEDPHLVSVMASASVGGFQGEDPAGRARVAACAKHYAAYGAVEGGRDYNSAELTERTLHDVYLPPFAAAVKAGVATIMTAFNDLGGVPGTVNRYLIEDVLRRGWGFQGFVVSDWNAVAELVKHGVAADAREAAARAVLSGVDMDMVSGSYLQHLAALVHEGSVPISAINESVRRILKLKFLLGLFEQDYTDSDNAKGVILCEDHLACARELARKSITLLKNNESILPIAKECRKLAVVGPLAEARRDLYGSWAPDGRERDVLSIAEAIRMAAPNSMEILSGTNGAEVAIDMARRADLTIAVVGESPFRSGEAHSIASLDLPPGQLDLVKALYETGTPLILVVLAGRPLSIEWIVKHVEAILWAWQPGIQGGEALAEIIFGAVNPSGKLPVTFPRTVGQIPIYYNHKLTGRPLDAAERTGSRYLDLPGSPLFPFGYGLSYTMFSYANLVVYPAKLAQTDEIKISVEVENSGALPGEEITQLYVRDLVGSVAQPVKELKGFQRVALSPGERRRISFTLAAPDLSFTGLDGKRRVEPGGFAVWVGPDSSRGLEGRFDLT